jgi:programmed cell death 6-interacting protein
MQSMSLHDGDGQRDERTQGTKTQPTPPSHIPARKPRPGKSLLGLPAISSSEWDFEELTLPPGPKDAK